MSFLTSLSLAQTQLTQLVPGILDPLVALRTLDIGGNSLTAVPTTVLTAKLKNLNFLTTTQLSGVASNLVNVSQLQGLQGTFWVEDHFCAPGFYSVGQKVCMRCPAGTHQDPIAAQAGDADWLSCGTCPGWGGTYVFFFH
jgi:hypothetical protein